jgi:hypothetical protein
MALKFCLDASFDITHDWQDYGKKQENLTV